MLIPKGDKDPWVLANRKSVSLINVMAKVLESLLKEKLQEFVDKDGVFPVNQFGFRKRLSRLPQESPCLFNIFVNDLPRAVTTQETEVFQFVDDTAILAVGSSEDSVVKKLEAASSQ